MFRLLAMTVPGFISFAVTLSSLPAFSAQQGATAASAGSITTVMLAATVLSQLAVPRLLRRLPTPTVIGIGLLLLGLPMLALLANSSLPALLGVAAVRGVGFGLFTVAGSMYTLEAAAPGEHGKAAGLFGLAAGIGSLIFVPLGVQLVQWPGLPGIVAIAAIPAVGLSVLGFRPDRGRTVAPSTSRGSVLRALGTAWAPSLVLTALTLTSGAAFTILPIRLPQGWLATVCLLLIGVAQTLARWLSGRVADRRDTRRLMAFGCLVAAVGISAIGIALASDRPVLLIAGSFLVGAGFGASQTLTMVAAFARAHPDDRALTSTIWNASFDSGTAIGAVLIGTLIAGPVGLVGAFGVVAAICVVTVPVALRRTPAGHTA